MSKRHEIAVIGGDGVGPEVTEAALAVLQATGAALNFTHFQAGDGTLEQTGVALPQQTLDGALKSDAVLFGAAGACAAQVILRLRAELKAWANLRPSKAYKGVDCLRPETDMMIVRENSEGMYFGGEDEPAPGKATATRVITDHASYRIARCAFEFAIQAAMKRSPRCTRSTCSRKPTPSSWRPAAGRPRSSPRSNTKRPWWTRWPCAWCSSPRTSR